MKAIEKNPFNLMYGKVPSSLIDRSNYIETIKNSFLSTPSAIMSYIITGVRGCGKTVLLREVSNMFKKEKDWIVFDVNAQGKIIQTISEKLYYEGTMNKLFLDWSLSVGVSIFSLTIKKEKPINNYEVVFERLLQEANDHHKRVLITIDEVNNTQDFREFAGLYQSLIGRNYDVYLLMTGLKDNVNTIISNKATSFLSRTPKIELGPLSLINISSEYKRIFDVDIDTSVDLAKVTCGYAFAYQVLGYILYENNKNKIDNEVLTLFDDYLARNCYDVIWKDLSKVEKEICFAIAKSGNGEVNKIQGLLNKSMSNINNYRYRLIEKGIIESKAYGYLSFTLPRFNEFVILIEKLS